MSLDNFIKHQPLISDEYKLLTDTAVATQYTHPPIFKNRFSTSHSVATPTREGQLPK